MHNLDKQKTAQIRNTLVASVSRLYDISIFDIGTGFSGDINFFKICSFVSDTYQNYLDGYKPARTTRIGLYLVNEKTPTNRIPRRDGTIVHLSGIFDEQKYRAFEEKKRMRYLLDILHWTIVEHCDELGWDGRVFEKAYDKVIDNDFKYFRVFEIKFSRNKTNFGQIVLRKSVDSTNVHFIINKNDIKVYSNENRFWLDPWNNIGSSSKWFDKDRFGVQFADGQFRFYYSLDKKELGYEIVPKDKSKKELEQKYQRLIGHVHASY